MQAANQIATVDEFIELLATESIVLNDAIGLVPMRVTQKASGGNKLVPQVNSRSLSSLEANVFLSELRGAAVEVQDDGKVQVLLTCSSFDDNHSFIAPNVDELTLITAATNKLKSDQKIGGKEIKTNSAIELVTSHGLSVASVGNSGYTKRFFLFPNKYFSYCATFAGEPALVREDGEPTKTALFTGAMNGCAIAVVKSAGNQLAVFHLSSPARKWAEFEKFKQQHTEIVGWFGYNGYVPEEEREEGNLKVFTAFNMVVANTDASLDVVTQMQTMNPMKRHYGVVQSDKCGVLRTHKLSTPFAPLELPNTAEDLKTWSREVHGFVAV